MPRQTEFRYKVHVTRRTDTGALMDMLRYDQARVSSGGLPCRNPVHNQECAIWELAAPNPPAVMRWRSFLIAVEA